MKGAQRGSGRRRWSHKQFGASPSPLLLQYVASGGRPRKGSQFQTGISSENPLDMCLSSFEASQSVQTWSIHNKSATPVPCGACRDTWPRSHTACLVSGRHINSSKKFPYSQVDEEEAFSGTLPGHWITSNGPSRQNTIHSFMI